MTDHAIHFLPALETLGTVGVDVLVDQHEWDQWYVDVNPCLLHYVKVSVHSKKYFDHCILALDVRTLYSQGILLGSPFLGVIAKNHFLIKTFCYNFHTFHNLFNTFCQGCGSGMIYSGSGSEFFYF